MQWNKLYAQRLTLLAAMTAVGVLLLEVTSSLLLSPELELLWSSPVYVTDEYGAMRYMENGRFREITASAKTKEFDVTIQTNNWGLIDDVDYPLPSAERTFVFVGDSFTAGQGGTVPWVPALRKKAAAEGLSAAVYNAGVTGTGLRHFPKILTSLASRTDFTDIVLICISEDFRRPYWLPYATSDSFYFVAEAGKPQRVATFFPYEASDKEIFDLVKKFSIRARRNYLNPKEWHLADLLRSIIKKPTIPKEDFSALHEIRALFPTQTIHLIHLPEKSEAKIGRYGTEVPVEELASLGIRYVPALHRTEWSQNMYHRYDGHPNDLGYEKISAFVFDELF